MSKTLELFFIPSISAFILILPYLGIPIYLFIVWIWYRRNKENLREYFFPGDEKSPGTPSFEMNEYNEGDLEELR